MSQSTVTGGDGAAINIVTEGPEDGPLILAIHGIGQSRLAWRPLLDAAADRGWRVTAMDLRGHGESDKPRNAYDDSQLWADDVAGVLEAMGTSLSRKAVVIAWSYGGAVLTDYLAAHGGDLVSGIVTVGATDKLGAPVGDYVQPQFGALGKAIMTDDTGEVAEQLLDMCAAKPLDSDFRTALLEESKKCPAHVRNSMFRRTLDNDAALAAFYGPVLVTHGTEDQMFTIALGEHLAQTAKTGTLKKYDGAGHMTLWDDTDRFLDDVASVVDS
ncbi:alpha/beta fold hydrolase [Epidermidibacterium keratini]|uniref:Alpha/beta fold hydrolase n=1 Tax=Epidermidibacterium keratini TaxID=1891644 RepID=A0A7L4YR92_9ACTN|nr:alpha/beta hydrolase [Epidermidibacterium keratini]QHC01463.1 alpha/beta fold hydrolase [Epidermidibacterium keratini]